MRMRGDAVDGSKARLTRVNRLTCTAAMAVLAGTAFHFAVAEDRTAEMLTWRAWENLPDPLRRKGMYGGTSNGHVLLAGGSNFPPSSIADGKKVFYRDAFVRRYPLQEGDSWRVVPNALPLALGEGAAVTTADGVLAIGGNDGDHPTARIVLLRLNAERQTIDCVAWPDLPHAAANAAATVHEGWLYVLGGQGGSGALAMFARLRLAAGLPAPGAQWESLPTWSPDGGERGLGRFGCFLVPIMTAAGPSLLTGGGLAAQPENTNDYLRAALLFDPESSAWSRAAELPRGVVLGAALPVQPGRVLVLGGSDGHDFARMRAQGTQYRIPGDVLYFDGGSGRWSSAGRMPLGVVGAAVLSTGRGWLVAGGEYSPGLRTASVYGLIIQTNEYRL